MSMQKRSEPRRHFTAGQVLWIALGLILLATFLTLLGLGLTSRAEGMPVDSPFVVADAGQEKQGMALAAGRTLSRTLYLPLVSQPGAEAMPARPTPPPGTELVTVPLGAPPLVMTGKGATLAEAQAGPTFWLDSQSLYASVHHPDGHHPFYSVARTYLAFDAGVLGAIPWQRVVEAALVLYPNANDDDCAQVDVQLYAGTWHKLDASAWAALGQPLATFRADEAVTSPFTVTLTLSEGLGKMVLNVDEGAIPPESCPFRTLKAGFFARDPESGTGTHLAIWIEEE